MSSIGWQIVHAIDERYAAGQRRGEVQPWERSRILAGDFSAITREYEPEEIVVFEDEDGNEESKGGFIAGAVHVLSWSRPIGSVDEETRSGIKPPPEPLFWIEIRKVVRHKSGIWRVLFDVHDRRMHKRLIRRKPPAMPFGDETEMDDDLARVEGAYTANPKAAIDHLEAVDDDTLKKFTKEAKVRLAENRKQFHAEQQVEDQARQLSRQLRDVSVRMVRDGVDPTLFLAGVQRMVSGQRESMKDAA